MAPLWPPNAPSPSPIHYRGPGPPAEHRRRLMSPATVTGPLQAAAGRAAAGDRVLSPRSPFSPNPEATSAPRAAGRAAAGEPSPLLCFPARGKRKKAGQFCPKALGLLSFFLRVLPPFVPFAKETLPFTIFQNKSLPHINVILIMPLTLPKIVQIFLENCNQAPTSSRIITTKPRPLVRQQTFNKPIISCTKQPRIKPRLYHA